jgi:predicted ATPase
MSQDSSQYSNIQRMKIEGFKSIKSLDIELKPLNILIGANGAGKSNFISAFKFLNELTSRNLQYYIAQSGGAERFLHFGSKNTKSVIFELDFGVNKYAVNLKPALPDTLIIEKEYAIFDGNKVGYHGGTKPVLLNDLLALETSLSDSPEYISKHTNRRLQTSYKIYHFLDTSSSAPVKNTCSLNDALKLQSDGGNLASFLYVFKNSAIFLHHYQKIVDTIQLVAPFFQDFILEPDENGNILPRWKHRNSEKSWTFNDLSDGTLRFICLTTLLQQPLSSMPETVLIDEPELGLHPHALNILASMLKSVAAQGKQVIVSSQSVTLINHFSAEDLLVADQVRNETVIRRLEEGEVTAWLEEYTLGSIWEKNIIGGSPDDF